MESLYAQQLQDVLLSWDYWELEKNASEGRGLFDKLPTIPVRFSSVDEYVRTFEPLLLEECAAQLLRRLEEGQASSGRRGVASASTNRGGPRPAATRSAQDMDVELEHYRTGEAYLKFQFILFDIIHLNFIPVAGDASALEA